MSTSAIISFPTRNIPVKKTVGLQEKMIKRPLAKAPVEKNPNDGLVQILIRKIKSLFIKPKAETTKQAHISENLYTAKKPGVRYSTSA